MRISQNECQAPISNAGQKHGVTIIPLRLDHLKPVVRKKASLSDILVSEYENIRFNLR